MSLINCSECGKEFSDQAKSCPNCGNPVKKVKATKAANGGTIADTVDSKTSVVTDKIDALLEKFAGVCKPVQKYVNKVPKKVMALLFPAIAIVLFIAMLIPSMKVSISFFGVSMSESGNMFRVVTACGVWMLIFLLLEVALYVLPAVKILPKCFKKYRFVFSIAMLIVMICYAANVGNQIAASSGFGHIAFGFVLLWIAVIANLLESIATIIYSNKK